MLVAIELACLAVALVGLALLAGVPTALLVAGTLGVLACERHAARPRTQRRRPS